MTRVNLATDPSLRSGTTDAFSPVGGATLSVTSEYAFYGKNALAVTKPSANGAGVQVSAPIPVVASKPYAVSIYSRLPIRIPAMEQADIMVQVMWITSLGEVVKTSQSAVLSLTSDADWFRVGGVWTAPAGATFMIPQVIQPLAGSNAATFILDALLVEQSDYIGGYFDNRTAGEKLALVNKALSAVPQVVNGIQLRADVSINNLIMNTIDEEDTLWVVTDIDGWWGQTDPELPNISRGTEDGSYDVEARLSARTIVVSGFFIPRDPEQALTEAINRLVEALSLTRKGGWFTTHEYPTKAAWVRLGGRPDIKTVSARGKTTFQITLRAGDPNKYHWDDSDPNGYTNITFAASDVIGYADNIGTATVTGVFTFTGPAGAGTKVFNATTGETMTLQYPLRGAGLVADAQYVSARGGTATVKTKAPHGLRVGDEVSLIGMVIPFSESSQTRIITEVSDVFPYSFGFNISTDDIEEMSSAGQIYLVNNDVLTVDTYNRSVTYNGGTSGHRNRLTTLTDWLHFAPGVNTVEFLDNVTEVEIVSKQLSSNVVTLTTAESHYLIPGEKIDVDLPVEKPLSKKSLTSNKVTLTTAEPHGFSVGDVVDVESTETSQVVTKSRSGNIATLTTAEPHGIAVSDSIEVSLPSTLTPSQKSLTGNVATLTSPNAHGFSAGDQVTVALPNIASVARKELSGNQVILTTVAPHAFSVGDSITVTMPSNASVTGKSRSGAQVVISTAASHGFSVGDRVTIALPETATPSADLTADVTTSLVTVTTATAHGFSVGDRISIAGSSRSAFNGEKIVESVPSSTTFTFRDWTLTSSMSIAPGTTSITNLTNQSYNGTKTLISASGSSFAFNL